MAKLRYFKIKSGVHLHGDKEYSAKNGDVVASPKDLCKMFVNKFEEIPPPANTDNIDVIAAPPEPEKAAPPVKPKRGFDDDKA